MNRSSLVALRRDLHRRPEPAWREFYTTARILEALETVDVDEVHVGPDAIAGEHRLAVPDDGELDRWFVRAREAGVDETVLERMAGGYTGLVAELHRGSGPTVGLRVDIDALPRSESDDPGHHPADEGFRPDHDDAMHACGHDAHAAIGVGVLDAVAESDFEGTLKVFFQPAEEVIGGGKAIAESEHLADVEFLLAVHVGLGHPTGEIVAGIEGFLAVQQFDVTFTGEPSHAGGRPEEGRNAIQAMAAAVESLYAIPRHSGGQTRINVGVIEAGTAVNIVAEAARLEIEVRGETTRLMEYVAEEARRRLEAAATMHDCEVEIETVGMAPGGESDDSLRSVVSSVAMDTPGVDTVIEADRLGGSEDATHLMDRVQDGGGKACYVGVGTDHPGGHHTATFDVDEDSIPIAVAVLAGAIERIAIENP